MSIDNSSLNLNLYCFGGILFKKGFYVLISILTLTACGNAEWFVDSFDSQKSPEVFNDDYKNPNNFKVENSNLYFSAQTNTANPFYLQKSDGADVSAVTTSSDSNSDGIIFTPHKDYNVSKNIFIRAGFAYVGEIRVRKSTGITDAIPMAQLAGYISDDASGQAEICPGSKDKSTASYLKDLELFTYLEIQNLDAVKGKRCSTTCTVDSPEDKRIDCAHVAIKYNISEPFLVLKSPDTFVFYNSTPIFKEDNSLYYPSDATAFFTVDPLAGQIGPNTTLTVMPTAGEAIHTDSPLINFNNNVYFVDTNNKLQTLTITPAAGNAITLTATASPIVSFADVTLPNSIVVVGEKLYFNGTDGKVHIVNTSNAEDATFASASAQFFTSFNSKVYYKSLRSTKLKLTSYDVTSGTIKEVTDTFGDVKIQNPANLYVYKNKLYFVAEPEGCTAAKCDRELYAMDTQENIVQVANLNANPNSSSCPSDFIEYKAELYFAADNSSKACTCNPASLDPEVQYGSTCTKVIYKLSE